MNLEAVDFMLVQVGRSLPAIAAGLALVLAGWLVAGLARRLVRHRLRRLGPERGALITLASAASFWACFLIGLLSGLGTMGVDVSALVVGLGLAGLAVVLAIKDALANLLAGVLILLHQPFRHGDRVVIAGHEGRVAGIGLRYTTIEGDDGRHLIPNQATLASPLTVRQAAKAGERPTVTSK